MIDALAHWIETSGAWMYLLAPLFMVVVAILPFPAEVPAMLNGMIFGPLVGLMITWSGAVVGAVISFELAHRFGRPLCEKLLSRRAIRQIDGVTLSAGWPGLLTVRLVPTIAFTLVNWAAGLTTMRRATFLWTTALGIVPGTIVFTLSGTGLAAFYRSNPALTAVLGGLLAAVVVLTAYRYRRVGVPPAEATRPRLAAPAPNDPPNRPTV